MALSSPAICRYCGQEIYGKTEYWHYWDLATRNFLCTSLDINHPFTAKKKTEPEPESEPRPSPWRCAWNFLTNS